MGIVTTSFQQGNPHRTGVKQSLGSPINRFWVCLPISSEKCETRGGPKGRTIGPHLRHDAARSCRTSRYRISVSRDRSESQAPER